MFSKKDFIDRIAFWSASGGKWSSVNPDYKPGDQAPEGFEYHASVDMCETVMGFTIYAFMQGTKMVIWKGYHYWHELKSRSVYLSLGTQGQICNGETHQGHDMYFEILSPNGQVMHILNHDEIVSDDEIRSSTQTLVNGQWQPMSSLNWKRIR